MKVCPHQVIARSFGCGVRGIWRIRRGFMERCFARFQRSVHFVSRDVMKPNLFQRAGLLIQPIGAGRIQERKCADDVCLDELAWTQDRPVYMAFRCEMDDGIDAVAAQNSIDQGLVADVAAYKGVAFRVR